MSDTIQTAATIDAPVTAARDVPALERLRNADRCLTGALHELCALMGPGEEAVYQFIEIEGLARLQRTVRRVLAAKNRERGL